MKKPRNLKEVLKDKLSEEELKLVPSSFDIIGSKEKAVAIVEIPEELKSKEKLVAKGIMQLNRNVKSILKKTSGRKGEFRTREYKLIVGDKNTEVIHKEYDYILRLDPRKVYFSPREATERQRIAEQTKDGEIVLVMFSGISAFPIAIAKKQDINKIYAVELNPEAHQYALDNIRINKLSHKITPINGDVKEMCKRFYGKCNRVIMPLPLGAESFLDIAVKCLKKNGIIHFYSWGEEKDLFSNALMLIKENLNNYGKEYEIIKTRKVLPYAPGKWKICVDFKVK